MDILIHRSDPAARRRALAAAAAYGPQAAQAVEVLLRQCPAHAATPLLDAPSLARGLGLGALWVKDERDRLGLASFKALGGALAVLEIAQGAASRLAGREAPLRELIGPARSLETPAVFTAATAGNHGRSVAAGAALVGARCVIFVPEGAPEGQIAAIARHGAEVIRVAGAYDDALAECRARAAAEGWIVVSDTAAEPGEDPPRRVQRGYVVIGAEIARQVREPPTHIFVQAGVGGLAAALAAWSAQAWRPAPRFVVVEPQAAPCLLESARAGRPVVIDLRGRTSMGRLECRTPSLAAWPLLAGLASAFVAITDAEAEAGRKALDEAGLPTSPSGAAGYAGLRAAATDRHARAALGLDATSRVVVLLTEAPTTQEPEA